MKVVHIESGLGNQMLSYCEYLVLKKLHPNEDIYIETIAFDCPEANEVIRQWNGYELENIFGIKAPNLKEYFGDDTWNLVIEDIKKTKWWDRNWNYPVHFTKVFSKYGLDLVNFRGDNEAPGAARVINMKVKIQPSIKQRLKDNSFYQYLNRRRVLNNRDKIIQSKSKYEKIFYRGNESIFTGQWLGMYYYNNGLEEIEAEIKKAFIFPDFSDTQNAEMAKTLDIVNAVAIHARRGDALGQNGYAYKFGYFRRAVKYIKKNVEKPVFVFFSDPGSVEWCKENADIFALDFSKDSVLFVDWNHGTQSFRDMQLMSHCKHAIINGSSFGWWGAYFIPNPNKITISPIEEIACATTHHL